MVAGLPELKTTRIVAELLSWVPMTQPTEALQLLATRGHTDIVYLGEIGSTAHGINVGDQDDLDYTAIRVEPWQEFVTGNPRYQSRMIRTQPEGHRSGPGDIDINLYTVRKFAALALKNNPSILNVFFLPRNANWYLSPATYPQTSEFMVTLRDAVASRQAGARYLGYMREQMERWRGERGQKNVNRPELVAKYGFDTKYAAHIIRLAIQGQEYLAHGRITLPVPESTAKQIRSLRSGGWTEDEAYEWARDEEELLKEVLKVSTTLPEKPNVELAHKLVADFYRRWYT